MPKPPDSESFSLSWRGVACRVAHKRNHIDAGWSKLTIAVLKPCGTPLPFAESGFFVHEMDEDHLASVGGPVSFFVAWLERDAATPRYAAALARWKQCDLFR